MGISVKAKGKEYSVNDENRLKEIKMAFSGSDINKISKKDALDFTRTCDKRYIYQKLLEVSFHGEEYQDSFRYNQFEMSYFCRAFNITSFGASKQSNRIKNRYKKYGGNTDIENYFVSLIEKEYPGFNSEEPRMDDLLANYRKEPEPSNDIPLNSYSAPEQNDTGNAYQSPKSDGTLENIVGGAVLILIIAFVLSKFFRSTGSFGVLNLLECVFFYGGIIALIVSVVRKSIRNTWMFCIASILAGLGFGNLVDGNVLPGALFLMAGAVIVYITRSH